MTHRRLAVFTAISAVLLLTACGGSPVVSSDPSESPTTVPSVATTPTGVSPSSTSEASPTEEPVASGPVPRVDLTCDELVSESQIAAVIGEGFPEVDRLIGEYDASRAIPRFAAVEAGGGLNCEWSNREAYSGATGDNPSFIGIQIAVMPDGAAIEFGEQGTDGSGCRESGCVASILVNDYWVFVNTWTATTGGALTQPVQSLVDSITTAVSELPAAPIYTPASPHAPASCEDYVDSTFLQSATGITEEIGYQTPHGGWSVWGGVRVPW